MKRMICTVLALCLLIPTGMWATEKEAEASQDILNERNEVLSEFLAENLNDEMAGDTEALNALIAQFAKEYPQYSEAVSRSNTIADANNVEPQEMETVDVYSNEIKVSDSVTKGTEYYVTYYDNGYYMVGEISYTRNNSATDETQNAVSASEIADMDTQVSISPMAATEGTVSANNIHNYYDDKNWFVCRTFLTASFYYDNANGRKFCQPTGWSGNQRVRNTNFHYNPAGYNYSHPYNDSVARVQRTQRFFERGYHLLDDDLRISCNHLGTIFKN